MGTHLCNNSMTCTQDSVFCSGGGVGVCLNTDMYVILCSYCEG